MVYTENGKVWPLAKNIRANRLKKIFGTIDNVIDLNNLAKCGFGKNFPDGGTHTQHIRVRSFFSFFFSLFTLFDEGAARTAEPILTRNTPFDAVWWESDHFLEMKNIGRWPWPWKGQNPQFCFTLKILTRIFSKTVRDRGNVSMEVR